MSNNNGHSASAIKQGDVFRCEDGIERTVRKVEDDKIRFFGSRVTVKLAAKQGA